MMLKSDIAMAVALAGSYSSDLTPSLGTSISPYAVNVALKRQTNNLLGCGYFLLFAVELYKLFVYFID